MAREETSKNIMEIFCSAILNSCCKVVIIPLCEDNIPRLRDRLKSEQNRVPRSSDLSNDETFAWMKRLGNLKKRSENLLATHENQAGFCSAISAPFNNYIAANLLEQWEKLDEDEPAGSLTPGRTGRPLLARENTAPIGAIEGALSLYQPVENVVNGEAERDERVMDYGNNNFWVLDSLGVRGEADRATRDLLSQLRMAAGNEGTAAVQSTHGIRLVRSKSLEIIHEERSVVLRRRIL